VHGCLQILLRLGAAFHAREFLACISRLAPDAASGQSEAQQQPRGGSTAAAAAQGTDGNVMGAALMALLAHMQKQPACPDCRNHVFILSSSFATCAGHAKMQKLLQLVCVQHDCALHFLQLTGPEAELEHAAADAAAAGGEGPAPRAEPEPPAAQEGDAFLRMVAALGQQQRSVTYSAWVADNAAVTDLLCQTFLRELLTSSSTTTTSTGATPELLLRFGAQTLPCSSSQHILQLDPWLLPAHLCPCHGLPLAPQTGSATAAAAAAARAAAASDAGSLAALQLVPESSPWTCGVTCQPVLQPLSSCRTDASILQLGRHTQLTAPGGWLQLPHALAVPAGQAMELAVQRVVPLEAIDSMLVHGMPLLLLPFTAQLAGSSASGASAEDDAAAGISDQQQQPATDSGGGGTSSADAGMLMPTLCQVLLEQQQVLVASSHHELLRRVQLPLLQWYMLQPAGDGSCLLLRQLACREQLLPPRSFLAAATASEDVVLLDAEQLEAVRASLQGLQGLQPGGGSDGRDGNEAGDDEGGDGSGQAAEAAEPLLLSCGLDAWMASVMAASAGTYAPPAVPLPAPAPAAAASLPPPPVPGVVAGDQAGNNNQQQQHPGGPQQHREGGGEGQAVGPAAGQAGGQAGGQVAGPGGANPTSRGGRGRRTSATTAGGGGGGGARQLRLSKV
jgi:hypothetical protein